jgi:hypothetical protein
MALAEFISGAVLVVVLLGLAGYFIWRQKKTLATLHRSDLGPEDRLYVHKQVRRRLTCSVLMIVFAGMLIGWFFLEPEVRQGAPEHQAAAQDARADRANMLRLVTVYWIVALLIVFAILFLAGHDLLATARFGLRLQRQLEAEQRAVLESDASRLRQERNGFH